MVATAAIALLALAVGCREEDRRAWVSILPGGDDEEEEPAGPGSAPEVSLTADSTAIVVDGDTLLTVDDLPVEGPGGVPVGPARLREARVALPWIAFATVGANEAVGVSGPGGQRARIVATFPGGRVARIAWSPAGRQLAWEGRTTTGRRIGVFDAGRGTDVRHPVLDRLEETGRSLSVEGWIDAGRLRLRGEDGAWVWAPAARTFALETHLEAVPGRLPPGAAPSPGGIFSIDLLDGPAPETVVLYRDRAGTPGALVLSDGPGAPATARTGRLLPEGPGFDRVSGPLELGGIFTLGSGPVLLLAVPTADGAAAGVFGIEPDGTLVVAEVFDGTAVHPAIFPAPGSGRGPARVDVVDLDGDGSAEVAVAAPRPLGPWRVEAYRWEDGRLAPAPGLEEAARDALGIGDPEASEGVEGESATRYRASFSDQS